MTPLPLLKNSRGGSKKGLSASLLIYTLNFFALTPRDALADYKVQHDYCF